MFVHCQRAFQSAFGGIEEWKLPRSEQSDSQSSNRLQNACIESRYVLDITH